MGGLFAQGCELIIVPGGSMESHLLILSLVCDAAVILPTDLAGPLRGHTSYLDKNDYFQDRRW